RLEHARSVAELALARGLLERRSRLQPRATARTGHRRVAVPHSARAEWVHADAATLGSATARGRAAVLVDRVEGQQRARAAAPHSASDVARPVCRLWTRHCAAHGGAARVALLRDP